MNAQNISQSNSLAYSTALPDRGTAPLCDDAKPSSQFRPPPYTSTQIPTQAPKSSGADLRTKKWRLRGENCHVKKLKHKTGKLVKALQSDDCSNTVSKATPNDKQRMDKAQIRDVAAPPVHNSSPARGPSSQNLGGLEAWEAEGLRMNRQGGLTTAENRDLYQLWRCGTAGEALCSHPGPYTAHRVYQENTEAQRPSTTDNGAAKTPQIVPQILHSEKFSKSNVRFQEVGQSQRDRSRLEPPRNDRHPREGYRSDESSRQENTLTRRLASIAHQIPKDTLEDQLRSQSMTNIDYIETELKKLLIERTTHRRIRKISEHNQRMLATCEIEKKKLRVEILRLNSELEGVSLRPSRPRSSRSSRQAHRRVTRTDIPPAANEKRNLNERNWKSSSVPKGDTWLDVDREESFIGYVPATNPSSAFANASSNTGWTAAESIDLITF